MSMKLFVARSVLTNLAKSLSAPTATMAQPKRFYASEAEADPEEYGYHPDPLEHARGLDKKMFLARLAGDDRYEPKVYYRTPETTREHPNLLPSPTDNRTLACLCEPDSGHIVFSAIRKGAPKRCECGHWFKLVDVEEEWF
ncbi:cytochrome c oxidase subunit vb domain-containing protein [Ditylenchus destructor]|nr:cytochrome c oxidase subunit vb domain-containing protein [Ditylenchus destructor]